MSVKRFERQSEDQSAHHFVEWHGAVGKRNGAEDDAQGVIPVDPYGKLKFPYAGFVRAVQGAAHIVVLFRRL